MTHAPLEVVAAAIAPIRPFADEVVIAVDASLGPELAAAHAPFADRVFRVPYAPPAERAFGWLHAQCSGDWILRIDSDEIPSPGLAARLPELTALRDVTHYWFARRWLFADRSTYLAEWPWVPDYQLRLVRNEPALLHFPGTIHSSATCLGPGQFITEPIYHFDFLLQSAPERSAKARAYDRRSQGISMGGRPGRAVNADLYVPERRMTVATAPVPEEDRDALDVHAGKRFLTSLPQSAAGKQPRLVTREEVDLFWTKRTLQDEAYAASLQIGERNLTIPAAELRTIDVDVTNSGSETWGWGRHADPPIHLSYAVRPVDGGPVSWGPRTPLPARVTPGSTLRVPLSVEAPETPGRYALTVDLVHENVRWFKAPVEVAMHVHAVPRVAIVAGFRPFRRVGDDAIVEAHLRDLADVASEARVQLLGEAPEALERRFGTDVAASVHSYLSDGLAPNARPFTLLRRWVPRTVALVREARRRRNGSPGSLVSTGEAFLATLERADVLLAASAGGFTSRYRREVLWPHAVTALAAAALGRPVVFSSLTVGPFTGVSDRIVAALALRRADAIVVRDEGSVRQLGRLGVRRSLIRRGIDAAAALEPGSSVRLLEDLRLEVPYAVVSARPDLRTAIPHLRAAADHLRARGIPTVFIPMVVDGEHDDRTIARELSCDRMVEHVPSDDVVIAMIGGARVAVGTRYHLAVFAAAQGVPTIGIHGSEESRRRMSGLAAQAEGLMIAASADTPPEQIGATLDRLLQQTPGSSPLRAARPLPGVDLAVRALGSIFVGMPQAAHDSTPGPLTSRNRSIPRRSRTTDKPL